MPKVEVPVLGAGGVNLLADPRRIRDDQLVKCKDLVPLRPGIFSTRPSWGPMWEDSSWIANVRFYGLKAIPFASDFAFVFVAGLSTGEQEQFLIQLMRTDTGAVIYGSSDVGTFQTQPFDDARKVHIAVMNRKMYVFTGGLCRKTLPVGSQHGAGIVVNGQTNNTADTSIFTFAGTGNELAAPKLMVPYRKRAAFLNFGPGFEDYMVMSNDYDPSIVGNDVLTSRAFRVGNRDGDQLIAGVEVMLTAVATPAQAAFLAFREYSAYMITGEMDQTTGGDSSLEVNRISFDCGCSSQDTIVYTPHGTIWASWDDVWLFRAGSVPVRIGTNIQPALTKNAANLRKYWHAEYHDGFYRLAIYSEGAGPADNSPCDEQWWLDLRSGPPTDADSAKWYGPMVYRPYSGFYPGTTIGPFTLSTFKPGTYGMFRDLRNGTATKLYGFSGGMVTTTGILPVLGDLSGDRGSDVGHTDDVNPNQPTAFTTPANEITPELWLKENDFGDDSLNKGYGGAELNAWVSEAARVEMDAKMDGGRASNTRGTSIRQRGFMLGADSLDEAVMSREFQSVRLHPDQTVRSQGKTIQLRLEAQPGVVVDEDTGTFQFEFNGDPFTAILDPNYSTSMETFLDTFMIQLRLAINFADTFAVGVDASGFLEIGLTNPANEWLPYFQGGLSDRSTRIIGGWLGYDTGSTPAAANMQTAIARAFPRRTPRYEIGGLKAQVYPKGRRPT